MLLLSIGFTCEIFCSNERVDQRHDDYGSRQRSRIEPFDDALQRDDRRVFGSVRTRHERKHRPRMRTVRNHDRNAQRCIDAGRHLDRTGCLLSARRLCAADCKGSVGGLCARGHRDRDQKGCNHRGHREADSRSHRVTS
jgi:hypothetical protein